MSVTQITVLMTELTVSVTQITVSMAEITVSVIKDTVSMTEITVSVTDITISMTEIIVSVTHIGNPPRIRRTSGILSFRALRMVGISQISARFPLISMLKL